MAAEIELKVIEDILEGEADSFRLTLRVVNAVDIDPNIFVVERNLPTLNLNNVEESFHHVAYIHEMDMINTTPENKTHQYVRKSSISRTYNSLDRMVESKKVMLKDVQNLLHAANHFEDTRKETTIKLTADSCTEIVTSEETYTFNGEAVII